VTTPQPVVLEHWPANAVTNNHGFSTVATWRGRFGPIEYEGKTYGQRVHEFRRFAPLPRLTVERFTLALDIDPAESKDLALLAENQWSIVDPSSVAGDPWRYRQFVQDSKGEFMVAKNMYVQTRGGWFSDRSICYLASGRPVLAQRTGWSYPDGKGLVGFSTLEQAMDGVREITGNYNEHSRAARKLAEDHFDSDKVLARLLEKLQVQ
ncbi:MAG: glycosyltransferase, partial [Chthoniobacterales bacterium]